MSVILFTIGLPATQSLLILVMAWSAHILLECFLVTKIFLFDESHGYVSTTSGNIGIADVTMG